MGFLTVPISRRHLNALVEEVQTLVNRMEASLHDKDDLDSVRKKAKQAEDAAKNVCETFQRRRDKLAGEIAQMEEGMGKMKSKMSSMRTEMRTAECGTCEGEGCDVCTLGFDFPSSSEVNFSNLFG
jgi:chromosome segregation ATPase|tara:strand:+ start:6581 stop:6958 length:378 start_codon:yes stop_codon:yes gene_type:complete